MLITDNEYQECSLTEEPWQTVAMRLRHGDSTYIPAHMVDWPTQYDDLDNLAGEMERLLLAMHLVHGLQPPEGLPLAEHCQEAERWQEVPALCTLDDGSVRIVPLLIGHAAGRSFRSLFEDGLVTRKLVNVLKAALKTGNPAGTWWILSRIPPSSLPGPLDDTSIALPVALAAMRLGAHEEYRPDSTMVFCAGNMDGYGYVYGMTHLAAKLALARENGEYAGSFCIVPADSLEGALEGSGPADDVLGVTDALEALCLQNLCQIPDPSISTMARLFPVWQKDPGAFLDWVAEGNGLPIHLFGLFTMARNLSWFEDMADDRLSRLLPKVLAVLARLEADLPRLRKEREHMADRDERMRAYEGLPAHFLNLFPFEKIAHLPISPALLQLAEAQVRLPDRDAETCRQWLGLADHCRSRLAHNISSGQTSGEGLADWAAFLRALGQTRARCRFCADDVPDACFAAVDRAGTAGGTNADLAACAHQIFVHLTLCGQFERAAPYAALALQAEPDERRRRQYHLDRIDLDLALGDLACACEDLCAAAGQERTRFDFGAAVAATGKPKAKLVLARLCQSLQLDPARVDGLDLLLAVTKANNTFRNKLLLDLGREIGRDTLTTFLAADLHTPKHAPEICTAFLHLCVHVPLLFPSRDRDAFLFTQKEQHPWEQWLYFHGLLLLREELQADRHIDRQHAALEFQQSLDLCLQTRDQTLHALALLPLARLFAAQLLPETKVLQTTAKVLDRVREHCARGQLYEPAFCWLTNLEPAQVLQEVLANPQQHFPVSWL